MLKNGPSQEEENKTDLRQSRLQEGLREGSLGHPISQEAGKYERLLLFGMCEGGPSLPTGLESEEDEKAQKFREADLSGDRRTFWDFCTKSAADTERSKMRKFWISPSFWMLLALIWLGTAFVGANSAIPMMMICLACSAILNRLEEE